MNETAGARSLDHFVVSVLDSESAGGNYEKLGFHVLPLMRHIELGSCNRVIQLKSTYLELIGDLHKAVGVHGDKMTKRFEVGEGLSIVSLTSDDLERDRDRLETFGLAPDPVISARRKIDMPDGSKNETDSSCFYVWRDGKEYLSLFYSAHSKPETIFIPGYYDIHPNTAQEITGIIYLSKDPAEDIGYFSEMFQANPSTSVNGHVQFVTPRKETLDIVTLEELDDLRPNTDWGDIDKLSGLPVSLSVKVESLEACHEVLSANGVESVPDDRTVSVDPSFCNGVLFVFHE